MKVINSKQKDWKKRWSLKMRHIITGDSTKNSFSKIKGSVFAVIFGLVLGMIPILIANGNPLLGYWAIFTGPFSNVALHRTIAVICVFIILGAGIGVSFRTGLFNIGATGQFLMAGFICVLIGQQTVLNNAVNRASGVIILVLVAAIIGALTAAIPGILKAFFNVHEVVTTILLNWIIFFIVRWAVSLSGIASSDGTTSLPALDNLRFSLGANSFDYIAIIFIALLLVTILFVVFKYTTFGYRLKLNGQSDSVAKYSGINIKSNIIYSMMISGAFAGIGGFIFYSSIEGVIPRYDTLFTIGFEAITVTLLAFSSPLGAILSGFFYGVLYQGQNFMQIGAGGNVVRETASLSLAIIIFMSALAVILVRVQPWKTFVNVYRLSSSTKIKLLRAKQRQEKRAVINQYQKIITKTKIDRKQKSLVLKELKSKWVDEITKITKDFQHRKIDILQKDEMINLVNNKYLLIIEKQNLNQYRDAIQNKKINLREINTKYNFLYTKAIGELEENFAKIKKEKNYLLNDLAIKKIDKDKRQQEHKKINQVYKKQKSELLNAWKEGK